MKNWIDYFLVFFHFNWTLQQIWPSFFLDMFKLTNNLINISFVFMTYKDVKTYLTELKNGVNWEDVLVP